MVKLVAADPSQVMVRFTSLSEKTRVALHCVSQESGGLRSCKHKPAAKLTASLNSPRENKRLSGLYVQSGRKGANDWAHGDGHVDKQECS